MSITAPPTRTRRSMNYGSLHKFLWIIFAALVCCIIFLNVGFMLHLSRSGDKFSVGKMEDEGKQIQQVLRRMKGEEQEIVTASAESNHVHDAALMDNKEEGLFVISKPSLGPLNQATGCIPTSDVIRRKREERGGAPLILFYTAFWGNTWGNFEDVYMKYFDENGQHYVTKPDCLTCHVTTDKSKFEEADLVMFHLPDTNLQNLPRKHCHQLFGLANLEAPPYYDAFMKRNSIIDPKNLDYLKQFEISSTYRMDSDVPLPHFWFWYEHKLQDALLKPMRYAAEDRFKDAPVAWIASKCETDNDRYGYVKELMKHVGVKSYGKCLHNADIPKGKSYDEEAHRVLSRHKFALAFENSNCDYYVTEKLTRCFELGVIPIIFGSPQIHMYLPNDHSALVVTDFKSPEALAARIREIDENDDLFRHYTSYKTNASTISAGFKKFWIEDHRHRACKLCDLLTSALHSPTNTQVAGFPSDASCKPLQGKWWEKQWGQKDI